MDAPGRRGRFATKVAKSSDDASAEGAFNASSPYIHERAARINYRYGCHVYGCIPEGDML